MNTNTISTLGVKIAIYRKDNFCLYGYQSSKTGQFCVSMTKGHGRGIKWIQYNRFETRAAAAAAFIAAKANLDGIVANSDRKRSLARDERSEAIKAHKETTPNPWQVGDLAYTSWGYDQTNVDLYQVTAIKSRSKMVVAPISGESVDTHYMQGKVRAVKDSFTSAPPIEIWAGFCFYKYGKTVSESWSVRNHGLSKTSEAAWHHYSSYA